jgi:hypothetical protein
MSGNAVKQLSEQKFIFVNQGGTAELPSLFGDGGSFLFIEIVQKVDL